MKKGLLKVTSLIAVILILVSVVVFWQNHTALAKKKDPKVEMTAAERMAKYSVKTKENTDSTIRKGRLSQINVVSEAATVLNILPIDVMNEMTKGNTLEQIAIDKGFTKDQFLTKLTELDTKNIDDAVNSGKISKEHGVALKEGQKDRLHHNLMMEAVDVNDHKAMDMNH